MKRTLYLILALALLALASPAQAQAVEQCYGLELGGPLLPRGYQQLTVSTAAVALTIPKTTGAVRYAILVVEGNPLRYRDDGVDPTSSVGVLVPTGTRFPICGAALATFKAIRQGGADATLSISYYGD